MLASDPPPMKYKSIVKKKDSSKVNLEETTPLGFSAIATKCKYPCPIFNGTGGIEALLYVEETFQKVAAKLKYDSQEAFDSWELCLGDSALCQPWAHNYFDNPHGLLFRGGGIC